MRPRSAATISSISGTTLSRSLNTGTTTDSSQRFRSPRSHDRVP
jgi:hypothetical protein